jgi:short-subunit dehydrogenase
MENPTRTLLVTGASSGIGEATARLFARQGWNVVLGARRLDRLQAIAAEIDPSGEKALAVAADVSAYSAVENLVGAAIERFGSIDLLFNNAGFGRLGWLESLRPQEDITAQIQTNLLGMIYACRAALPHLIARRSGHIVNMASMAGLIATPTYTVYAASKFAIRGFSQALRREVGVYNIHVSVIFPGGVKTEFGERAGIRRKTGLRTPGFLRLEAEDIARAVYGLARRPRRELVLPVWMHLAGWANLFFPGIVDWTIERSFVRKERDL